MQFNDSTRAVLDALDDPAMILEKEIIRLANQPAKALFGGAIEGRDLRLTIRHPQALSFALSGQAGDIDITGIGEVGWPWRLSVRPLGENMVLVRLIDRSAAHSAEKLRVDFVANASHELKTPLTSVLGYAESLEDGGLDPELSEKFARTIKTEANRMLRIIEDLMSLSRIEADRFVPPTDKVAIGSVIRTAVDAVRPVAQRCGCTIHVELQDDLPRVEGDAAQLAQVTDNLVSNAVRYGCTVADCRIRISAAVEDQWLRLEVSDTGPGIARQHLPFLTRRFYRPDPARSRDTGGTGLGLAIVKHIVERHRGLLSIDSTVGKGTTVTIRLPLGGDVRAAVTKL